MSLDQIRQGSLPSLRGSEPKRSLPARRGKNRICRPTANSAAVTAWLDKHPQSFEGLRRLAARLVAEEKWHEAKDVLEKAQDALSGICRAG